MEERLEILRRYSVNSAKELKERIRRREILRLPSGDPLKPRLYILDDSFVGNGFPRRNTPFAGRSAILISDETMHLMKDGSL